MLTRDELRTKRALETRWTDAIDPHDPDVLVRALNARLPETIRVSSGGDGPKVEIASRRAGASRPEPEASVSPNEGREGDQ